MTVEIISTFFYSNNKNGAMVGSLTSDCTVQGSNHVPNTIQLQKHRL